MSDLDGAFNLNPTNSVGYGRELLELYRHGVPRRDLLVMDPSNDPFNCGSPAHIRDAEWFAGLWEDFGLGVSDRVHLRRVHYTILSPGTTVLPDGTSYLNTPECWKYLMQAARHARTLGMVDPSRIEDQRNPQAVVNWAPRDVSPEAWVEHPEWMIPSPVIPSPSLSRPDIHVAGYGWEPGDHPVHVELFIEKSTQNDILVPLCERLGVNLTVGAGYTSHTRIVELFERAMAHDRPVRILCVTDFDPAGHAMPTALARYLQYVDLTQARPTDIAVESVALTAEQCVEFELPRIPIKESDMRRDSFEDRFGEGATELDALEALHPGSLARVVTDAVEQYRDRSHRSALADTQLEANRVAKNTVDDATAEVMAEVKAIRLHVTEAYERLITATSDAFAEYEQVSSDVRPRLGELADQYAGITDTLRVELPARDVPHAAGLECDEDWFYRSDRNYLTQLEAFRRHQRRDVA